MVGGVEGAGVQPVPVERGVLPVELLGHHHLAPGQARETVGPHVVRSRSRGPGQVGSAGVVGTHGPLQADDGVCRHSR